MTKKIATESGSKKCCKDGCLSILRGNNICQGVAQYLLHWGQKDSPDRKQTIAEWYRYANPTGCTNAKLVFQLPYDASGMGELASHKFQGKTLCLSALRVLFDIGRKKWTAIKVLHPLQEYLLSTREKESPATGISAMTTLFSLPYATTFKSWKILVSPLQTRIVREVTGEVTEQDNADNNIYLPMCLQKRLIYCRFCEGQDGLYTRQAKVVIK